MITSLILLWLLSPADLDYQHGMALARRQQWTEAEAAFRRGQREAPTDKRFPLELAGLAFKQHHLEAAKQNIRRALHLDPHDAYANEFAGTLYLLDGNLEAALEYWNRIGKPRIGEVRIEPQPPLDPVLLDRAFAFAPESMLALEQYRATRARIDLLDAFPAWTLELAPEPAGDDFDAILHTAQTGTWLTALRGLPFETVYPELLNVGHQAIDIRSMLRFDKEKRRASFELSAPLARMPSWRYRLFFDGRNENWVIPDYGGFNMKRTEAGAEVASVIGGTWQWTAGTEFTHRSFANSSFAPGDALEVRTALRAAILRIPERRFSVSSGTDWRLGRFFGQGEFSKLEGSVDASWFPRARGDDYETSARFRAGTSGGAIPFDELYFLGLERDTDLWLRAHIGTADGKKGSAPIGPDYLLANWEQDKIVHQGGLYSVLLGPFFDSGRVYGSPGQRFGFAAWMFDTGLQAKVRLPAGVQFAFTWGKDLRTGHNAWYATLR